MSVVEESGSVDRPDADADGGGGGGGGGGAKNKKKKRGGGGKKHQSMKKGHTAGSSSGSIETLSAASAGQNLAVFLKSMAMTSNPYDTDRLQEAKDLYEQVQRVRSKLLPSGTGQYASGTSAGSGAAQSLHPDLYATKFSLAELLEVMGDEETANVIRQEILDTYEPPLESKVDTDDDESQRPKQVVIEKTRSSPPG